MNMFAARGGESRHSLPRFVGSKPRTTMQSAFLSSSPIHRSPAVSTMSRRRKDLLQVVKTKKTEFALPRALPPPASDRRPGRGHRARRRAFRFEQGAQGAAEDAGRGAEARRHRLHALGGLQALRRRPRLPSCFSRRRTRVAPTTSGSTTCRRTAFRSTTSGRRSPRRATYRTCWSVGERAMARGNGPRTDQSFLVPKAEIAQKRL